ncbi:helix-turn-helix domain-containing protein [Bradyrhizobium genosp. P]|uniref:helix-turn-helix domain-containing protein n=1 Tax=Bradyrhizobium genosp. P TaxID=83641 RepID=UPI003CEFE92B
MRDGWTGAEIGAAFGVADVTVRRWRRWFCEGNVQAFAVCPRAGPLAGAGETVAAIAAASLADPV